MKKIYLWIIVILLVLNVSTIGTIVYHNYKSKKSIHIDQRRYPVQKTPRFLQYEDELNIHSESQKQLLEAYKTEAEKLAEEMQQKRLDILANLSNEEVDTSHLNNLAHEFGKLHEKLKLMTIELYLQTKEISTPEEQEELFHYFNYLLKKGDMQRRHPGEMHRHKRDKRKK